MIAICNQAFHCPGCRAHFTDENKPLYLPICSHMICETCLPSVYVETVKPLMKLKCLDCFTEKEAKANSFKFQVNYGVLSIILDDFCDQVASCERKMFEKKTKTEIKNGKF